jgi:hypothetical protein
MPKVIAEVTYYRTQEVLSAIGVSRQTLWRWRREAGFPQGCRLRGKLLFTGEDLEFIREFAFHVEPLGAGNDSSQLALFNGASRG